jgi:hypothetical protein
VTVKITRPKLTREDKRFLAYLEGRLIPDLKESGREFTAEDFETCIEIIQRIAKMEVTK